MPELNNNWKSFFTENLKIRKTNAHLDKIKEAGSGNDVSKIWSDCSSDPGIAFLGLDTDGKSLQVFHHPSCIGGITAPQYLVALVGFGPYASPVVINKDSIVDIKIDSASWQLLTEGGASKGAFLEVIEADSTFQYKNIVPIPHALIAAFIQAPSHDPATVGVKFMRTMSMLDREMDEEGHEVKLKFKDHFVHALQFCHLCATTQNIPAISYHRIPLEGIVQEWSQMTHENAIVPRVVQIDRRPPELNDHDIKNSSQEHRLSISSSQSMKDSVARRGSSNLYCIEEKTSRSSSSSDRDNPSSATVPRDKNMVRPVMQGQSNEECIVASQPNNESFGGDKSSKNRIVHTECKASRGIHKRQEPSTSRSRNSNSKKQRAADVTSKMRTVTAANTSFVDSATSSSAQSMHHRSVVSAYQLPHVEEHPQDIWQQRGELESCDHVLFSSNKQIASPKASRDPKEKDRSELDRSTQEYEVLQEIQLGTGTVEREWCVPNSALLFSSTLTNEEDLVHMNNNDPLEPATGGVNQGLGTEVSTTGHKAALPVARSTAPHVSSEWDLSFPSMPITFAGSNGSSDVFDDGRDKTETKAADGAVFPATGAFSLGTAISAPFPKQTSSRTSLRDRRFKFGSITASDAANTSVSASSTKPADIFHFGPASVLAQSTSALSSTYTSVGRTSTSLTRAEISATESIAEAEESVSSNVDRKEKNPMDDVVEISSSCSSSDSGDQSSIAISRSKCKISKNSYQRSAFAKDTEEQTLEEHSDDSSRSSSSSVECIDTSVPNPDEGVSDANIYEGFSSTESTTIKIHNVLEYIDCSQDMRRLVNTDLFRFFISPTLPSSNLKLVGGWFLKQQRLTQDETMKIMRYLKKTLNAEWGTMICGSTSQKQGLLCGIKALLHAIAQEDLEVKIFGLVELRHLTVFSPALKASCPTLSTVTPDCFYCKLKNLSETFASDIFNGVAAALDSLCKLENEDIRSFDGLYSIFDLMFWPLHYICRGGEFEQQVAESAVKAANKLLSNKQERSVRRLCHRVLRKALP